MKLISITTPCFNEEENVQALHERIDAVFRELPDYDYELIFIDNHSTDRTVEVIKSLIERDNRVRLIVNTRNFGQIRSPYHALLQARGDAVVNMVSDLQDPPEMIRDFIKKWEEGYKIVVAVKTQSKESTVMWLVRRFYYRLLDSIANVKVIQNFTGFGLYDQRVIEIIRSLNDPYPYFRGIIAEIGFEVAEVPFTQPRRERGVTKNNFYTLYEMAILGITNHSKVPIRLATMTGIGLSALSLLVAVAYFIYKLLYWDSFEAGMAPIVIGLFFFASVQMFFIGLLGEYIGSIHTQILRRPLVIEEERINFGESAARRPTTERNVPPIVGGDVHPDPSASTAERVPAAGVSGDPPSPSESTARSTAPLFKEDAKPSERRPQAGPASQSGPGE